VACGTACTATMGPYPSWMGKWAFGSQATSCVCPAAAGSGLSGLLAVFAKAKDELGAIGTKEALRKEILDAMHKDLTPEEWEVINRIMEKIRNGQDLTPQDYDELQKMLQHP
jgi:hypothetical protein